MIAANHNRRLQPSVPHHLVEEQSCTIALAITEPADSRRKPLKRNMLAGPGEPLVQPRVVGKQLEQSRICRGDIGWIA